MYGISGMVTSGTADDEHSTATHTTGSNANIPRHTTHTTHHAPSTIKHTEYSVHIIHLDNCTAVLTGEKEENTCVIEVQQNSAGLDAALPLRILPLLCAAAQPAQPSPPRSPHFFPSAIADQASTHNALSAAGAERTPN
jgi:hypothetical protein